MKLAQSVSGFCCCSGVSCRTVRLMSDSHVHELADAVRQARVEHGYPTQKALAIAMGVNPKTIQNLENASRSTYSATTLSGLDEIFGWQPGSASALLQNGTAPEPAEDFGGPRRFAKIARARMQELGLKTDSAMAKDVGLTEDVLQALSAGRLPDEMDPVGIEMALQWEPGEFPRVLIGYEPRELPADIAGSAGCGVTAGMPETMEAARKVSSAMSAAASFTFEPIQMLDTQSRMFAVAWLLGSDVNDFDLLNGRQYQTVLRTVAATFEAEVSRLQTSDPRYASEPTPSGFTRAEIDNEMARGGDAAVAIRRLMDRESVTQDSPAPTTPAPTSDADGVVVTGRFPAAPPPPPAAEKAAARGAKDRPEWEAMHQWDNVGEETQVRDDEDEREQ